MLEKMKALSVSILMFFFGSKARFVLLLGLLVLPAVIIFELSSDRHPSSFTVMVTNMEEMSGGSGSVIMNSPDKSVVLTNSHVCDVLNKEGGLVKKEDGSKYMVSGYHKSEFHDLCAIFVAADLGNSVKIAKVSPRTYEKATITGHPALLPNVINEGSFGERKVIQVMTGIKPCTEKDVRSEQDALLCFLIGGKPVITSYESVVVSALIMGGSSGSAVLNSKGELSGVVFAGQGSGLSYAFIVPFEYVSIFVREELNTVFKITKVPLEEETLTPTEQIQEAKRKLAKECKKQNPKLIDACGILKLDLDIPVE